MKRIVVGISGSSGPILAVRLLQELGVRDGVETHLVASPAALRTLAIEAPQWTWERVRELADVVHDFRDIAAGPASGTFRHDGMVIIPCSMNSVGCLAGGISSNLLLRAADVTLKERRRLVIVPREAPLHLVHLRNLATLAELGACILPPMLAMYTRPETVDDLVSLTVGKVLDQLGIEHLLFARWREGLASGASGGHFEEPASEE